MIKGNLIDLRTIRKNEIQEVFQLICDLSERGQYWNLSLLSEVSYLNKYKDTGFWDDKFGIMVFTDKSDNLIGEIGYSKVKWNMPGYEIHFRVYKEHDRSKGYTTEALKLFTKYLFNIKPINRLEVQFIKGNTAGQRVAEKCGYNFEGTKKQAVYSRGKYHDIQLYSIIRQDLQ